MRSFLIIFTSSIIMLSNASSQTLTTNLVKNNDLYYEKGSLKTFTGTAVERYENGKIKTRNHYSNGLLNGVYESFRKTGQLEIKGKYTNGKIDGIWQWYDKNDQIVEERTYKNNVVLKEEFFD